VGTTDQPPLQQASAKAVIVRDGRLLCVRKIAQYGGQWEVPGGRLDEGESYRGALVRELREELGFQEVRIGRLLDAVPADPFPPFPPMHYLLVEVGDDGREPELSDEHDCYDWLTAAQLARLTQGRSFNPSLGRALARLLAETPTGL